MKPKPKEKTTKVIRFDNPGGTEVLKLEEIPLAEPGSDEIRIKIEALSLNRADTMFRENKYVLQPTLPASRIGTDAAGVIEAIGKNVRNFKIGDRVVAGLGFEVSRYGTHGETAILPAKFVLKYPEFLSPEEAASVNMPFLTAWGALIDNGQMSKGDFVLITAASSSIGVAAIQLANAVGAIPIATTRNTDKRSGLLDIGAAHVIVTSQENLVERVLEITSGKGARLIFDPIFGGVLETFGEAAADGGIVFLYGAFGQEDSPVLPLFSTMMKEIRFWGYVVYSVFKSPERLARGLDYIYHQLQSGKLKVVIDKVFPLEQYRDAHRYLESNEQIGRVVVTV